MNRLPKMIRQVLLSAGFAACMMGCRGIQMSEPAPGPRPFEGKAVTLEEYVANAPDILAIEMEAATSDEQVLKAGETISLSVTNTLPDNPIDGPYTIAGDGTVDLGYYGKVKIDGQTVIQAKETIKQTLQKELSEPSVQLTPEGARPISGEYLIRPDGKVKLGFYGEVFVSGMTLPEIEKAIVEHLEQNEGLVDPKVSVDVASYNSMVYYIITDGGGYGDEVQKLPLTGHETFLDAMSEIGGLPQFAAKTNVWIARPIPGEPDAAEILPIDWVAITKHGQTATNYQILPGDRLYIKSDQLIAADNVFGKMIQPVQRILSTITLFNITFRNFNNNSGTGGGGGFGR
ncbi:MAG: polysaccharide biosynthesis/export family protein [Planctomycetota bacterium]